MRWLLAVALSLLPGASLAQSCGPDAAPAQAAAQGYTCETYRWGSGNTIADIDTTNSFAPGFKLYQGTLDLCGYATTPSDYHFAGGKLILQTVNPDVTCAAIVLNTCSADPAAPWVVGYSSTKGFYAEFVGEWDATGSSLSTGKPAFFGLQKERLGMSPPANIETDNPDDYAFGEAIVYWTSVANLLSNIGTTHQNPARLETGHKWGVLSTESNVTWWYDDTANGHPDFSSFPTAPGLLFTGHTCWILQAQQDFPMTIDSIKIWQASSAPSPSGGGGFGTILKRR